MVATTRTVNFRLAIPDFDQRLWHDDVNDNFYIIDAIIKTYLDISGVVGVWANGTSYNEGDKVIDPDMGLVYEAAVGHVSPPSPVTFEEARTDNPSFWTSPNLVARSRGAWITPDHYSIGDFVVSGQKYAICIQDHDSGPTFDGDVALGYWDVLLDASTLPAIPATTGQALKYARVKADETGLEYVTASTIGVALGLGTISTQDASAVNITGGVISGATISSSAVTISGGSISGIVDLAIADGGTGASTASGARTNLGLGTAAVLNVGVAAGNVVQLDGSAKLPAVDGSQLTGLPTPHGSNIYLWSIF